MVSLPFNDFEAERLLRTCLVVAIGKESILPMRFTRAMVRRSEGRIVFIVSRDILHRALMNSSISVLVDILLSKFTNVKIAREACC